MPFLGTKFSHLFASGKLILYIYIVQRYTTTVLASFSATVPSTPTHFTCPATAVPFPPRPESHTSGVTPF
jgi:hypothetical protein